jgi:hypothetical protein
MTLRTHNLSGMERQNSSNVSRFGNILVDDFELQKVLHFECFIISMSFLRHQHYSHFFGV